MNTLGNVQRLTDPESVFVTLYLKIELQNSINKLVIHAVIPRNKFMYIGCFSSFYFVNTL